MRQKTNLIDMLSLLALALLLTSVFPISDVLAAENEEISFLLTFVADSDCTFIRNGKQHLGKDASEHLAMKYNHVKGRIKTADVFIEKIASKSSFTGRPYQVLCGSVTIPTKLWLQKALAADRASSKISRQD